jgi:hypothetical protein
VTKHTASFKLGLLITKKNWRRQSNNESMLTEKSPQTFASVKSTFLHLPFFAVAATLKLEAAFES